MEHLVSITLYPSAYAKKQLIKKSVTPTAIEWQWKMGRGNQCQIAFDISIKLHTITSCHSCCGCFNSTLWKCAKKIQKCNFTIITYEQSNALPACFSDIQKTN